MVTNEAVERVCVQVSEYSEEQMAAEYERFFQRQPDICDFIVELTSESSQNIQELSLFLSYMVFKAVESAGSVELSAVSHGTIESAFRESESWIEKINHAEENDVESSIMANLSADNEPHLLQYVISEINQPMDDGTQLEDEQKGEVFFVLKTVISSFSRRPFETELTEPK